MKDYAMLILAGLAILLYVIWCVLNHVLKLEQPKLDPNERYWFTESERPYLTNTQGETEKPRAKG